MDSQNKIKKVAKLPSRKFRLFLTFLGTAVSTVALTITTLAWFMSTLKGGAEIPDIGVDDEYAHSFSCALNSVPITNGSVEFTPFYPGNVHRKTLTFSLTNLSSKTFKMNLFFEQPAALEEVPYIDATGKWGNANYYYYLGSQIALTSVSLAIDGASPTFTSGAGNHLVETNSVGVVKGQVNGVANEITSIARFYIIQNVSVPASKTLTGTLEFTFVDNGTDQSMYFVDWPTTGVSRRSLSAFFYRGI